MNFYNMRSRAFLGLLILWGCALTVQAAEIKIKVVAENASIRSKPGIDGTVIEEKLPLGAVYLSAKKEGEWYEVKYRSKLGIQLTGYIHEMSVEVVKEGEEATGVPKQPPAVRSLGPGRERGAANVEIGLIFGLSSGTFMNDSSSYSYSWGPYVELVSVSEQGSITHKLKTPFATMGGFLTYYFGGGFGIRLGFDYNPKQSLSGANSNFRMSWTWTQASGGIAGSREKNWAVNGDVSVSPLNLNLIYKLQAGRSFAPYFTAGLTYFLAKANLSTSLGYGFSWLSADQRTQYIDYFIIPVTLSKSLNKAGGNVGAGLDLLLTPNFGLNIDAAYYIGPSQDVLWPVQAGSYPADYYDVTLNLAPQGATTFQDKISKLNFKLSYFRIAGGLKILF
jgi:hypothetical protein